MTKDQKSQILRKESPIGFSFVFSGYITVVTFPMFLSKRFSFRIAESRHFPLLICETSEIGNDIKIVFRRSVQFAVIFSGIA